MTYPTRKLFCVMCGQYVCFKNTQPKIILHVYKIFFQQRLNDKMYSMKKKKVCDKSDHFIIERKLLDVCLIEVQQSAYNFDTLKIPFMIKFYIFRQIYLRQQNTLSFLTQADSRIYFSSIGMQ